MYLAPSRNRVKNSSCTGLNTIQLFLRNFHNVPMNQSLYPMHSNIPHAKCKHTPSPTKLQSLSATGFQISNNFRTLLWFSHYKNMVIVDSKMLGMISFSFMSRLQEKVIYEAGIVKYISIYLILFTRSDRYTTYLLYTYKKQFNYN